MLKINNADQLLSSSFSSFHRAEIGKTHWIKKYNNKANEQNQIYEYMSIGEYIPKQPPFSVCFSA